MDMGNDMALLGKNKFSCGCTSMPCMPQARTCFHAGALDEKVLSHLRNEGIPCFAAYQQPHSSIVQSEGATRPTPPTPSPPFLPWAALGMRGHSLQRSVPAGQRSIAPTCSQSVLPAWPRSLPTPVCAAQRTRRGVPAGQRGVRGDGAAAAVAGGGGGRLGPGPGALRRRHAFFARPGRLLRHVRARLPPISHRNLSLSTITIPCCKVLA